MKTKPIPAIVMLIAGFVTCIMSIRYHLELKVFTKTLLLVLIAFYFLGIVIKIILDKNFPEMKEEEQEDANQKQEQTDDGSEKETETDQQETVQQPSEQEQLEEPKEPETEEEN